MPHQAQIRSSLFITDEYNQTFGSVRATSNQTVQSVSDGSVAVPRGVLVAEGGLVGGVTEAVHDLFGTGARARRESAGEVSEVVQVDLGDADLGAGLLPGVLPDVRREGAALLASEDVAVLTWLREGVEVAA